jgi:hypothetical protein
MKYYCITPATKDKDGVCVLPTMEKPKFYGSTYEDMTAHSKWQRHITSLPKSPTSCERVGWFSGELDYQSYAPHWTNDHWKSCSKAVYETMPEADRRKFIVPQSEEKDGPSVRQDSIVPCDAPLNCGITDQQISEILHLGFTSAQNSYRLYPDNKHAFAYHKEYLMGEAKKILTTNKQL